MKWQEKSQNLVENFITLEQPKGMYIAVKFDGEVLDIRFYGNH